MRSAFLFLCLSLAAVEGAALEQIRFTLAALSGAGLQAEAIELSVTPQLSGKLELQARAKRLTLEPAAQTLKDVEIRCLDLRLSPDAAHCLDGKARIIHPWLQGPELSFSFSWDKPTGALKARLQSLQAFGGRWRIDYQGEAQTGQVTLNAKQASLSALASAFATWLPALRDSALSGQADVKAKVRWDAKGLEQTDWELGLSEGAFSAVQGQYLGEGLTARLTGRSMRTAAARQQAEMDLALSAGAILTPFAYLEPKRQAMRLSGQFDYDPAQRRLAIKALRYRHPDVVDLTADARLALDPFELRSLQLDSAQISAQALYREALQPVLSGSLLENVAWQGAVRLSAALTPEQGARLRVDFSDLGVRDQMPGLGDAPSKPRFALEGLSGKLNWSEQGAPSLSEVSWRGGAFLGALEFGAARLSGQWQGRRFTLLKPLDLPLLDGRLMIDTLKVSGGEDGAPAFDFDGFLTPVSLTRLSESLGWPPLAGSLSGVIPGLSMRKGRLVVDGNLLIRVFDGAILIRHLSLDDLLGYLPTLRADVQLRGLDLETLTETFSFGKITGRLDGHIDKLYLENWRPISFDAAFATPAEDDSAHYISQRAVDNISNLGGAGIGGSLSRTFLGMFEQFRYERLGISCRLQDGVCRMGGVAPGDPGYYLVIGSGVPQINIKGFNSQTDWTRLVEQLQQISAGGEPVIELNAK